ncbi:MAG: hypothetical protein LBN28_06085, partial [Desulfovibrio sp.]|nr:hypothetical protein [Desulfovibrio sp.]
NSLTAQTRDASLVNQYKKSALPKEHGTNLTDSHFPRGISNYRFYRFNKKKGRGNRQSCIAPPQVNGIECSPCIPLYDVRDFFRKYLDNFQKIDNTKIYY